MAAFVTAICPFKFAYKTFGCGFGYGWRDPTRPQQICTGFVCLCSSLNVRDLNLAVVFVLFSRSWQDVVGGMHEASLGRKPQSFELAVAHVLERRLDVRSDVQRRQDTFTIRFPPRPPSC